MNAEQIRAAIAAAMTAHDADGMSMDEIREALGYADSEAGLRAARAKVKRLLKEGAMIHSGHRSGSRVDGLRVQNMTPVYRLVAS